MNDFKLNDLWSSSGLGKSCRSLESRTSPVSVIPMYVCIRRARVVISTESLARSGGGSFAFNFSSNLNFVKAIRRWRMLLEVPYLPQRRVISTPLNTTLVVISFPLRGQKGGEKSLHRYFLSSIFYSATFPKTPLMSSKIYIQMLDQRGKLPECLHLPCLRLDAAQSALPLQHRSRSFD